jgi:Ca-activated chloride channel family protein
MKKYICVLSIISFFCVHAVFERQRATVHAQKGQWAQANELLQPLVVSQYENPELLYDAGVVSLKAGNSAQASAYFQQAAEHKNASSQLKEQAHFNAGNAAVALNELKKAIEHYQETLKINSKNEYAKHNLERVQQMLNEQENQQQENQDQNKEQEDKDQEKNQEEDQQQKDQQQKNGNGSDKQNNGSDENQSAGDDSKGDQQKGDGDQKKDDAGKESNKQDSSSKSQQGKNKDKNGQSDSNDAGNESPQDKQSKEGKQDGSQNKDGNQRDQKESQGNGDRDKDLKNDSKNADDGGKQPEKQGQHTQGSKNGTGNGIENTQKAEQSQGGSGQQSEFKPEDQWIAQLLDERNESDGNYTKQLTKMQVDKNLAGTHGQNCW